MIEGSVLVPTGRSSWEFGVGKDYKTKARKDYGERPHELSAEERSKHTFMFVTPRTKTPLFEVGPRESFPLHLWSYLPVPVRFDVCGVLPALSLTFNCPIRVGSIINPNFGDYTDNFIDIAGTTSTMFVAWSDGRYNIPHRSHLIRE